MGVPLVIRIVTVRLIVSGDGVTGDSRVYAAALQSVSQRALIALAAQP
jgi:hypothetical protein